MIVGVICTIAIGLIALHQALMAASYRRVAAKLLAEFTVRRHMIAAELGAAGDAVARDDVDGCVAALKRASAIAGRP